MKTPEADMQEIQELLLDCERGQFPADAVAFFVGKCIIKYEDAALIRQVPEKISSILWGMIAQL